MTETPTPATPEQDVADAYRALDRLAARLAPKDDPAPSSSSSTTDATMDRRSWYMSKAVADALAEEVEELHYATRRPKHEVLAALISVAMEHRDEVRQRLNTVR